MDRQEELEVLLSSWQGDLEAKAREVCQPHWDWLTQSRLGDPNSGNWPVYSPQVRNWKGSVSINWLRLKWIQKRGEAKKSMVSEYVKRKSGKYTDRCFPLASENELARILDLEQKLASIRMDLRLVGKLRGTLRMDLAKRRKTTNDTEWEGDGASER